MNELVTFNDEVLSTIRSIICKDATPAEFQAFVMQCKRTGLDPITRQIYWIKGNDGKVHIQTSIDGFRLVAERSGVYEGQTSPLWCGDDGVWKDVWLSKDLPRACKIGVYKKGFREPLYAIALFDEYAQFKRDGSLVYMWNKMPALMLAKVAESLALRKAFPNDLSGLYSKEEMMQSEIEVESIPQKRELQKPVQIPQTKKPEQKEVKVESSPAKAWLQKHVPSEPVEDLSSVETSQVPFELMTEEVKPDPDEYVVDFGKFSGKRLHEIEPTDLAKYVTYIEKKALDDGKPLNMRVKEFVDRSKAHLNA